MPIYEYGCKKCGNEWEKMQKMSDLPPKTCPKCKSRRVEKLMSLSAFSLKGSGWYADGYSTPAASKTESGSASTKSSEKSKVAGESKNKSADKPAKKASTKKKSGE